MLKCMLYFFQPSGSICARDAGRIAQEMVAEDQGIDKPAVCDKLTTVRVIDNTRGDIEAVSKTSDQ